MSQFRVRPQIDPLEREQREIAARRARCDERAKRVLHAKTRLLGIDTMALNQQVMEKQERERLEAERTLYYDDLSSTFAHALNVNDSSLRDQKKAQLIELNNFRKAQEKEKRRKELMEKALSQEQLDVDTNFLHFGGEDLNNAMRTRAQKLQQQDWLAQQIEDLQNREQRDRQETASYEAMQSRIVDVQDMQHEQAQAEAARARMANAEFNQMLAAKKRADAAREAQRNQLQDDQELTHTLNSHFLNEANGVYGGASNFKGFTTEQRQRILDEQKEQMDEARGRRIRERQEEAVYAQQQEEMRRAMIRADREREEFKKQQRLNLAAERKTQALEKTMRYDYLDNVVYTNTAQDSFFDQFGKSCR